MEFRVNMYPSRQRPDPVRPFYKHTKYYPPVAYSYESRYNKILCVRSAHNVHPNKFNPQAFEQSYARTYHQTVPRMLLSEKSSDKLYEVTATTENRLDRIAYEFYGDGSLWWVISKANTSILFDPMNIPRGTILRIPTLSSVYEGGIL